MSKRRIALVLALVGACGRGTEAPPADVAPPAPAQVSERPGPAGKPVAPPPILELERREPDRPASGPPVDLPPRKDLRPPDAPPRYEDGAYSIRGLREDPDALLEEGAAGGEILVRAHVLEIYSPPPCPADGPCPPGKLPHLWVADAPGAGKRHSMLVANHAFRIPEWDEKTWRGVPAVVLEVGKQYTFKGKFTQFSDSGFADARGLLDFIAYKAADGTWVAPPGAPWHPIALAQAEAQQAELIRRVQAADRRRGSK